jgi:hypothetical protein
MVMDIKILDPNFLIDPDLTTRINNFFQKKGLDFKAQREHAQRETKLESEALVLMDAPNVQDFAQQVVKIFSEKGAYDGPILYQAFPSNQLVEHTIPVDSYHELMKSMASKLEIPLESLLEFEYFSSRRGLTHARITGDRYFDIAQSLCYHAPKSNFEVYSEPAGKFCEYCETAQQLIVNPHAIDTDDLSRKELFVQSVIKLKKLGISVPSFYEDKAWQFFRKKGSKATNFPSQSGTEFDQGRLTISYNPAKLKAKYFLPQRQEPKQLSLF